MVYGIGNGQLMQLRLMPKIGALNCMHDQQAIILGGGTELNETTTRNPILRLLWETYGAQEVVKWGVAVLDSLQQAEVLQQGMHEGCLQSETQEGNELDDGALPRAELVAGWILRDMRKRQECGCTPQGWESTEQQDRELNESMPKLSHQDTPSCKDLFNMWEKGKGIRLLQQTLYQIQEVWKPVDGSEGGDGMKDVSKTIVRRLTPL